MTDDDLLRPREVAHMFGVRPTTVARWAREGRLAAVRTPGGHRRYLRGEVQKMLDDVGASLSQARGEKA
jgi:excisionase family DNA binding protein